MSDKSDKPEETEAAPAEKPEAADASSDTEGAAARPWYRRPLLIRSLIAVGVISALIMLSTVGIYSYARKQFFDDGAFDTDQVFLLERGMGLTSTARALKEQNLISDARIFRYGVRLIGQAGALKAGEFAIPAHSSMNDILRILVAGQSILHRVTIAEGLTSYEALQIIAADPVLVGDVPDLPAEGSLLPETYLFTRGTSRAEIVAQMEAAHDEMAEELWAERAENLPFDTLEEALVLASIVEKETGLAEERPRVAAVFVNRMRRGMRLQSDPTIIYGITKGEGPLGRPIRRSEINAKTAYNTYQIDGLPPTPIANSGREALAAVLNPPQTKDLYFVADGTGGHAFAETLAQHQANVAKWRRIERARRQ